jgi:hypothetical protein
MMTTYYFPDSVSSNDPERRYVPVVREHEPAAFETPDGWMWMNHYGSTGGHYVSEDEAENALEKILLQEGWTTDRSQAEKAADEIAARRNGHVCRMLRALRRELKNDLHVVLLGKGQAALSTVAQWTRGVVQVPADKEHLIQHLHDKHCER